MNSFIDDDNGYAEWSKSNPSGYVLNCDREPKAAYLMLHRASCRTVTGVPTRGSSWTKDYAKVCSSNIAELDDWARAKTGGFRADAPFAAPDLSANADYFPPLIHKEIR